MDARIPALATLLTFVLGACSVQDSGGDHISFRHISRIDASHIAVHAQGDIADAIVSSDGGLALDGKTIILSPAQQDDMRAYYAAAEALRRDAIATGKAGLATAASALGSVAKGLASGDPDRIGGDVDAHAAKVEASAAKVCADVADLQARQDAISASLPAFKPYATITDHDAERCDR
jgi:hypothetical protein